MNSQQRKTVHTDMNSTMISLQHHNLILRPNLKPKTTSHSQKQTRLFLTGFSLPLSVEPSSLSTLDPSLRPQLSRGPSVVTLCPQPFALNLTP